MWYLALAYSLLLVGVVSSAQNWGHGYSETAFACSDEALTLSCDDGKVVQGQVFGGAFNDNHTCSDADKYRSPQPGDCSFNMPFLVSDNSDCFWKKQNCTYHDYVTMIPNQGCSTAPQKMLANFLYAAYNCIQKDDITNICDKDAASSQVNAHDYEQYITTPGYPKPFPVNGENCTVTINVEEGFAIELELREGEVALPPIDHCTDARIMITSDNPGFPIDTYCKAFSHKVYAVSQLDILFYPGREAKHYEGFVLRYKKVRRTVIPTTPTVPPTIITSGSLEPFNSSTHYTTTDIVDVHTDKEKHLMLYLIGAGIIGFILCLTIVITVLLVRWCRARGSPGYSTTTTVPNDSYDPLEENMGLSRQNSSAHEGYQTVVRHSRDNGSPV